MTTAVILKFDRCSVRPALRDVHQPLALPQTLGSYLTRDSATADKAGAGILTVLAQYEIVIRRYAAKAFIASPRQDWVFLASWAQFNQTVI